ncbi:hypothetical protein JTB14_014151 [Gonioctena quinquepunctata]|nr:hypothetical protein JTB14_014151 [Gonioctena quinquepunctata]
MVRMCRTFRFDFETQPLRVPNDPCAEALSGSSIESMLENARCQLRVVLEHFFKFYTLESICLELREENKSAILEPGKYGRRYRGRLSGRMGYLEASKAFNVPQSTLEDRVKKAGTNQLTSSQAARKAKLYGAAFLKAAGMRTAVNGFKQTGIYPLNRNIFPDHLFAPSTTTDRPVPVEANAVQEGDPRPQAEADVVLQVDPATEEKPVQRTCETVVEINKPILTNHFQMNPAVLKV